MKISAKFDPKTNPVKIRTGLVRGSYVSVMTPRDKTDDDGNVVGKEYSMQLIMDDDDTVEAIRDVVNHLVKTEFGGKKPRGFKNPLRNGSEMEPEDDATEEDFERYEETYKGKYFMNVRASEKYPPEVVRRNPREKVESESEIKSGDYFIVSISGFAFSKGNSKGVGFGLNNVQFIKPGKALGATHAKATDDFEDMTDAFDDEDDMSEDDML